MSAEVQDLQLVLFSSVASCQQAMGIVPAMASSGSKPSGATESSVSGATESSGSSAMELSSPAGLLWSAIFTHTHDKDLRAQYAAENKQKLEVVSVPAKASSASKPSGATEPNVSENKRKLEASGEAVQKAMRGGRKQLQDEAKNDGGVIKVDDWFEEMEGVIDEGVQLEEMEDVDRFFHHLVS